MTGSICQINVIFNASDFNLVGYCLSFHFVRFCTVQLSYFTTIINFFSQKKLFTFFLSQNMSSSSCKSSVKKHAVVVLITYIPIFFLFVRHIYLLQTEQESWVENHVFV